MPARPHRRRAARFQTLAATLSAVAALALAAGLSACGSGSSPPGAGGAGSGFAGAALPSGIRAPVLTLTDQHGQRMRLGGAQGGVTVVAFVSTRCAHACTLIAQQIRGALDRLALPVQTLFISVDPAADTAARAERFLRSVSLSTRARYPLGPPAALADAWRGFRVAVPASAGQAAFERAAPVVLLDRAGAQRVLYQQEQLTPESLLHDIGRLQSG
jgi:cytochrome oxidase Cu insertion factor (SCO1/SenC/PrrC family)